MSQYFYITTRNEFVVQVTNTALRTSQYRLDLVCVPNGIPVLHILFQAVIIHLHTGQVQQWLIL